MKYWPQTFLWRRVLGLVLAVILAFVIDAYFSSAKQFWVPLTALVLLQSRARLEVSDVMWQFVILLLTVMVFFSKAIVHDVMLGGAVALLASGLFFPAKKDQDFNHAMQVMLQAYVLYLTHLKAFLIEKKTPDTERKYLLEKIQTEASTYPEWVYASGFSPLLRSGHRFFLKMVERLGQTLYAFDYTARLFAQSDTMESIQQPLEQVLTCMQAELQAMTGFFKIQKLSTSIQDLTQAMVTLETTLRAAMMSSIALWDINDPYLPGYALLAHLKDMQNILEKMREALR